MTSAENSEWLQQVIACQDGYELEAVNRFSDRLLRLAAAKLPQHLQVRVEPADIVQSALKSFFMRNANGQYCFEEAGDVWRLLAAITYRKVQATVRNHHRQQRDPRKELADPAAIGQVADFSPSASTVAVLLETFEQIMKKLPDEYQEIVQLRMEGYSIQEIATKTELATRTIHRALARTKQVALDLD